VVAADAALPRGDDVEWLQSAARRPVVTAIRSSVA